MNEAPDSCVVLVSEGLEVAMTVNASPPRRTGSMWNSFLRASVVASGWTKSAVWMSPHFHFVMSSPIRRFRSATASSRAVEQDRVARLGAGLAVAPYAASGVFIQPNDLLDVVLR